MAQKLGKADWVASGLAALRSGGAPAVRIEAIARDLGVTKGSFYWHFPDQRALFVAMWEAFRADALARSANCQISAAARLMAWVDGTDQAADAADFEATEAALRSWAVSEPDLARMLRAIDLARIDDLAATLRDTGVRQPGKAARMLHAARMGFDALGQGGRAERKELLGLVTSQAG